MLCRWMAWCCAALPMGVMGQSVVLSVGSASAAAGGSTALAIGIASMNGAQVSTVQWSFSYSADVAGLVVTPGSAATVAQKSVTCAGNSCIAYGLNTQPIGNGTLAIVTVSLESRPSKATIPIQVSAVVAASPNSTSIPAAGGSGIISVLPPSAILTGLNCATITVSTPGTTTCTVTLSSPAQAGGYPVALSSSGSGLAAPSGITVAAGSTAAEFTATAAPVSLDQTATVTANAGGVSQTAILDLLAPVGLSSLSCVYSTLASDGSTLCTAALNQTPPNAVTVSLSSNDAALVIPASIIIPAGQALVGFQASTGSITSAQVATVTASLNGTSGTSATFRLNLVPAATPVIASGGILNAASFATGANGGQVPVGVGSAVSIFGMNLGTGALTTGTVPLPTVLGGVSVTFNSTPAPLSFVTSTQINAQVPFELLAAGVGSATASVVVTVNGVSSVPALVQIVPSAPGVFSVPAGVGNALLRSSIDGALAAPPAVSTICGCSTRPITAAEYASIYVTGLGPLSPPILDGAGDLAQVHTAVAMPVVLIGGIQAQVTFAGQAPQFPGIDQINIVIPPNTAVGDSVPFQVQSGGMTSTNKVTVAIAPGP